MKTRKPQGVDPFLWERLPHSARLALMSNYARTPERREALRRAAMNHAAAQLDRAVKDLERALSKEGSSDYEY